MVSMGEFKEKTTADSREHNGSSYMCQKHLDDFGETILWTDKTKAERLGSFESVTSA